MNYNASSKGQCAQVWVKRIGKKDELMFVCDIKFKKDTVFVGHVRIDGKMVYVSQTHVLNVYSPIHETGASRR